MVRFESDKLVIELFTGGDPRESWMDLSKDLIRVLQNENPELRGQDNHYEVYNLLDALLLEWKQVKPIAS